MISSYIVQVSFSVELPSEVAVKDLANSLQALGADFHACRVQRLGPSPAPLNGRAILGLRPRRI